MLEENIYIEKDNYDDTIIKSSSESNYDDLSLNHSLPPESEETKIKPY